MPKFIPDLTENDVTSEQAFVRRRHLIKSFSAAFLGAGLSTNSSAGLLSDLIGGGSSDDKDATEDAKRSQLTFVQNTQWDTKEQLTSEYSVTHYNNFYEFGLDKSDPAKNATKFKTDPWSITVDGLVEKPGHYSLDSLLDDLQQEERIYRLRCVEAWSMVVPWVGVSLASLIKKLKPLSGAKYITFYTLLDPEQMPGQKPGRFGFSSLEYPYVEGLRMDEAMNPLTMLATGIYGKQLLPQNGAPIRLVVPWKYGFKNIKSIVRIEFSDKQPINTWHKTAPKEYGFYANVNPTVAHPRWGQDKERRIVDESVFSVKRIDTQMFNGYGEQVASMYKDMDLRKYF